MKRRVLFLVAVGHRALSTVRLDGTSFAFRVASSLKRREGNKDGKVIMPPIEFDSSESFLFAGTPYAIAVYKTDAGFVAYGECLSCPRHRMKSETVAHKHLAKNECRELVRQHHAKHHTSAESLNTR